ncbi:MULTISPECIES: hypothetical protein [Pseudomonas]|uniref:Uncharacterized protein n=1 Tax=Pseudomonas straminea TaxID=47882 RepID=A0A1I1W0N2_PSEOC|nr:MULTISPECIES: hypothetical protein [Pseudomonas]MBV7565326.1 hypothetical protein [Pseudomonas sp. sia0905]PZW71626.1 hypothetical protein F471_00704 [Pseudomonas sp. URMO17WK12:I1]TWE00904.1 hypothetical protein FB481_113131 [Pseudomonas sp. AG1028]SFD88737.1 hypothetical protein SAMN05216372_105132 [Pseudomonas straminea]GLX14499.1 hypothetical protein Pstr01_27380 [Pseudomonas straminea]
MGQRQTQILKQDLKAVAEDLRWVSVDLLKVAEKLRGTENEADAWAILRMVGVLTNDEDRLNKYASEIKAGRIVRSKA